MTYYTCPKCGCNLDPGEKCDCVQTEEKKMRKRNKKGQKWNGKNAG